VGLSLVLAVRCSLVGCWVFWLGSAMNLEVNRLFAIFDQNCRWGIVGI
jgi:hypothetical protein